MSGGTRSQEVDDFVETRVLPQFRGIVEQLRLLMGEYAPDVEELMSYGIPGYRRRKMLAVISPTKKGITFAFSRGAAFEDEYGLLEGVGKVSKNVRMRSEDDFNADALRYYIDQAIKLDDI